MDEKRLKKFTALGCYFKTPVKMQRKEWEFVERRLLIDELASKLFKWNIYLNDNKKTWKILFTESENSCYILCCKLLFMLDVMSIIKNQFVVKTKEEEKLNKFMIIVHRWHFWMFCNILWSARTTKIHNGCIRKDYHLLGKYK